MSMSGFEKLFVNRESKGRRNIARMRESLQLESVHDVLEIGVGIGTVSAYLSDTYGMKVVGTDVDPMQVELARARYPEGSRLRFAVEDATDLSFPDESFDLVIAHNVFHHLSNWEVGFREAHRVLRPGGSMDWLDLEFSGLIRQMLKFATSEESFFSLNEVSAAYADEGFKMRGHWTTSLLLIKQHHLALERI
jgi:ubiquinone/menaquinone biosynthesis C-methylase UbiE